MSKMTKLLTGIMLILVPTIQFGGTFLLGILSGSFPELQLTDLQRSLFRAGHAHAGVLLILGLVAQVLADGARLPGILAARIGFVVAPMLISGGFFAAAAGVDRVGPGVGILWAGVIVLGFSTVALGIGLVRGSRAHSTTPPSAVGDPRPV